MIQLLFALALACSDEPPTAPETGPAVAPALRLAVVIGYNGSDNAETQPLRYADDDAIASHLLLTEAGVASTLLVATDQETAALFPALDKAVAPTRANVLTALTHAWAVIDQARAAGRSTEFFLFYTGHGNVERGVGYLTLADGRFTRRDLYREVLEQSHANRNHLIIDACRSYYFVFERGAGGDRTSAPAGFSKFFKLPTNTGLLLSTSSDRESHEWERIQAGIFSHEVRSALRGAADADRDGQLTYAEVGAFLEAANAGIDNPRFRPDFFVRPPRAAASDQEDLSAPLLGWRASDGTAMQPALVLDSGSWQHLYVEDAQGRRLADAHPATDETFALYLPGDRPLFVSQVGTEREATIVAVDQVALSTLALTPPRVGARGAAHLAFDRLFGTPFSRQLIATYTPRPPPPEPPIPPRPWLTAPLAIGVGGVLLVPGVLMHGVAVVTRLGGDDLSNLERQQRNTLITAMNIAALSTYALGVVVAGVGAILLPWPEPEEDAE